MQADSRREILSFLVLGLSAFLFLCLVSHDPQDSLGAPAAVRNACGPVGAFVGFHSILWFGWLGAYGVAAVLALVGLLLLFRRSVVQPGWKIVGATLMILTLSSFEVAVQHGGALSDTLAGGYYGQFFYGFLLGHLSTLGTCLLLGLVLLVAFILATDTIFYPAFAWVGQAVSDGGRLRMAFVSLGRGVSSLRLPSLKLPRFLESRESTRRSAELDEDSRSEGRRDRARKVEKGEKPARKDAADAPERADKPEKTEKADKADKADKSERSERAEKSEKLEKPEKPEKKPSVEPEAQASGSAAQTAPSLGGTESQPTKERKSKPPVVEEDAHLPDTEEITTDARAASETAPADPKAQAKTDSRPPLKIRESQVSSTPQRKRIPQRTEGGNYKLPPLDILDMPAAANTSLDKTMFEQTASKIEETLRHFKIDARVVEVQKGPTITQYELALAAGIKVHKIINLSDDLAMALKAQSIRIVAPIPGKSTVGVEVPNKSRTTVGLRELMDAPEFRDEDHQLPLALGKDVAGNPIVSDLGDMPHLLIAGSTGSGKSICINSIITNLLLTRTPDEVKLILVDPKMVELAQFENIPHLLAPVVTDMKKAPSILAWTVDKMEERYELLAMVGVRHINSYNALGREKLRERLKDKVDEADMEDYPDRLPYIVVIIDELADLMMTASKEVETSITRLSQKSRAVGIHVILATQRPSVDVITGLIKANMPCRISFHVASKVDSRTILDRNGAEKLLGKGDMLYQPPGTSALVRVQGTYISDKEIRDVVNYAVQQAEPQFNPELTRFGVDGAAECGEEDELYQDAVRIVLGSRRGSVTLLQRQLQIGYTRASRLMEIMHEHGLVGPFKGSKAREVYYTIEEWEEAQAKRRGGSVEEAPAQGGAESESEPGFGPEAEEED